MIKAIKTITPITPEAITKAITFTKTQKSLVLGHAQIEESKKKLTPAIFPSRRRPTAMFEITASVYWIVLVTRVQIRAPVTLNFKTFIKTELISYFSFSYPAISHAFLASTECRTRRIRRFAQAIFDQDGEKG